MAFVMLKSCAKTFSTTCNARNFSILYRTQIVYTSRVLNLAAIRKNTPVTELKNVTLQSPVPTGTTFYKKERKTVDKDGIEWPSEGFQTKLSYLNFFEQNLLQDVPVPPRTAFMMIKCCGSRMAAESEATRIQLVNYVWEKLKSKDIKMEISLWNTLLSVYIENRHDFDPVLFLQELREYPDIEPSQTTFSLLLQMYAARGDPTCVMKVIKFMLEKDFAMNESKYAWLIQAFAKSNNFDGVQQILQTMRDNKVKPKFAVYNQLINAFADRGDLFKINETIVEMQANNVTPTCEIYVDLLEHLCLGGHSHLIPDVFERLPDIDYFHNHIRSVIQRCTVRSDYIGAIQLMSAYTTRRPEEIQQFFNHRVGVRLFNSLKLSNKDYAEFVKMSEVYENYLGEEKDSRRRLLAAYLTHNSNLDWALQLVDGSQNGDVALDIYHQILKNLNHLKDVSGIVKVFDDMSKKSIKPDHSCYRFVQPTIGDVGSEKNENFLEMIKDTRMKDLPFQIADHLLNQEAMTLDAYVEYAQLSSMTDLKNSLREITALVIRDFNEDSAFKLVKILEEKNIQTMTLVDVLVNTLFKEQTLDIYAVYRFLTKIIKEGIPTSPYTRQSLMKKLFYTPSSQNTQCFLQFVDTLRDHNIELTYPQLHLMLKVASKQGDVHTAHSCFEGLKTSKRHQQMREVLYQNLIMAYHVQRFSDKKDESTSKILELCNEMEDEDVIPTPTTMVAIIASHLYKHDFQTAARLLEDYGEDKISAKGLNTIRNVTLSVHLGRGDHLAAERFFEEIKVKGTVSISQYRIMLSNCENTGDVTKMDDVLDDMSAKGHTLDVHIDRHKVRTLLKSGHHDRCLDVIRENVESERENVGIEVMMTVLRSLVSSGETENVRKLVPMIRDNHSIESLESRLNDAVLLSLLKAGQQQEALVFSQSKKMVVTSEHFEKFAKTAAELGDVEYINNMSLFLRNNNSSHTKLDNQLLKALDENDDIDGMRKLHVDRLKSNVSIQEQEVFLRLLNDIVGRRGLTNFNEQLR